MPTPKIKGRTTIPIFITSIYIYFNITNAQVTSVRRMGYFDYKNTDHKKLLKQYESKS